MGIDIDEGKRSLQHFPTDGSVFKSSLTRINEPDHRISSRLKKI